MGISVSQLLGVGVIVDGDEMTLKKKVPGCSHNLPEGAAFCPECGSPSSVDKEIRPYEVAYKAGLKEESEYETFSYGNSIFIGKVLVNQSTYDKTYKDFGFELPTAEDIAEGKAIVEKFAKNTGINIEESRFGLVAFPMVSS